MARPSLQLQDRFMLRMPDGMRDRIAEIATKSGRSMNAEIIARLEQSFADDDSVANLESRMAEIEAKFEALDVATDERLDRVEDRTWRLLEHAGLYDPNPEK